MNQCSSLQVSNYKVMLNPSIVDLSSYQQITPSFSYSVFQLLGGGVYGRVYKGFDHRYKKSIAVKHINLKTLRAIKGIYERQIQILQQLKHKNIIEFYGSYGGLENADGLFLFFELCEKGTLSDYIAKKKITQAQALQIFKQLVQGMTYVNSKEIFHRDIKPDNLLLNSKNEVKIADFGTAKEVDQNQVNTYRRCTPVYAAPEVYLFQVFAQLGQKYTQKCDVFSAGYILYQLLTGEQLTRGINTEAQLTTFLKKCKTSGMKLDHPALSQRWISLLKRMMAFESSERPTFAQIRNILNSFVSVSDEIPKDRDFDEQQKKRSQEIVQLTQRTLEEQQRKNNYFINILKIFQSKQNVTSWVFPKISKLLLIFYSLLCYVKQAEDGLNYLHDPQKIYINGYELKVLFGKMIGNDKGEILNFIEAKANKLNKAVEQIRSLLQRQIIPQVQSILRLDESSTEKKLLMQLRVENELKNYREREYSLTKSYIRSIKQCLNNSYQTDADLQILSQDDLRTYLAVNSVALIDELVGPVPHESNHWPLNFAQIENLSKRELIQEIINLRINRM